MINGHSAVDDPMHCYPRKSVSGHPQHRGGDHFDCCTKRYGIVVLLPNSEHTEGNYKKHQLCNADEEKVCLLLCQMMFSSNGGHEV